MTSRNAVRRSVPKSALPAFTPVPRKCPRHDGWTPERQRAFIAALADTGCVAIAARMVNMSQSSVYQLRRQPGAESFRAAMDAAQTFGLQVVKDEAFDRAMNGQLVPVFVGGKLMGFRRVKNDRMLMFILRHYGQDASGRKTTVNYFSTRATAAAAATPPSPLRGEGDSRSERGEGESGETGTALAAAEASTTTVKTVISGAGYSPTQLAADEAAANLLNAFEGVPLDAEAQAQIYRTLEACAERRRALEHDPENDPERFFIGEAETTGYLGELESGVEGDWVEYKPEGEYSWESLGEGGQATEIDKVLAGMAERRAAMSPEQIAAEKAEAAAAVRADIARQQRLPAPEPDPDSLPRTGSGDPRLDRRNWSNDGYVPPAAAHPELPSPQRGGGIEGEGDGEPDPKAETPVPREEPAPAQAGGRARKPYKKRTPKPPFTPPKPAPAGAGEARKAEAIAEVAAERRKLAEAEAERRRRMKGGAEG